MIEILPRSHGRLLGVRVRGKITREEYDPMISRCEELIREYGKISILVEIEPLESIEPSVFWEDLKFGVQHLRDFDRFAFVGDARWHEAFTRLSQPFMSGESRYFRIAELEQAWQWLEESLKPAAPAR
jgi:universal stress protein A